MDAPLSPQLLPPRERGLARRAAIAAGLVGVGSITGLLAYELLGLGPDLAGEGTCASPPIPRLVAPAPIVVPVLVPAAAGPAPDDDAGSLGPCPAPVHRAPARRLTAPPLDGALRGLATSATDAGRVAAWTDAALYASADGGATWRRVLDGPGPVHDASFDCHGRVLAVRGDALGIHQAGAERWRTVPGLRGPAPDDQAPAPRVVAAGAQVAVLGGGDDEPGALRAAFTDDGGASWRYADLGWYDGDDLIASLDERGTLRALLPWEDCMGEGLRRATVGASGVRDQELDDWAPSTAQVGGRVYGVAQDCVRAHPEAALCTWTRARGWQPVAGALPPDTEAQVVGGAGRAAVVAGDRVAPLAGARLGPWRSWPGGEPLAIDAAGRVWGLDADGGLFRR